MFRVAELRIGYVLAVGIAVAILIASAPTWAESTARKAPGGTVQELLVLVRRFNPEIAARVLETEAALQKAAAATSLDDPTARVTSDEVDRIEGKRINKMIYSIEQEFPLWGKLELRRRIAESEVAGVRGREHATRLELEARVKTLFAQYYAAARSREVTRDVRTLLQAVSRAAQARYTQGTGTQADAIRADVELSRLEVELISLERNLRTAQARLNALVARPAGSPLANPTALRPIPSPQLLRVDVLLNRARQNSPVLATASAEIAAAAGQRTLVDRSWYPDPTLSVGAITRDNGPSGVMATIGVRIPLQWGRREAQAQEASARTAAARAMRDAFLLTIQGNLSEAVAGLDASRRTAALLTTGLRPQTEAAYQSALSSYQVGRGDLTAVLETARRIRDVRLELLKVQTEQQMFLADIERSIGGEL